MPPPAQLGNAEIHHHNNIVYNLHINITESAPHKPEQFYIPDTNNFASKVLCSYMLFISCDILSDPLRQHASDFMHLVDIKILAPFLIQNDLLTLCDMEYLQMQTITDSDKKFFIYVKLLRLGEEGYKKFIVCLNDSDATTHAGHTELYNKLSMTS